MGLFDITPQLAPLRNYTGETQRTLQAQINMAPQLYRANEQYQPLYNALNLQNLDQFLTGTPEAEYQDYRWVPARYSDGSRGGGSGSIFGDLLGGGGGGLMDTAVQAHGIMDPVFGALFGGDDKKKKRRLVANGYWTPAGTRHRAAQRGFLDIYKNDIAPTMDQAAARSLSTQRASDIADVAKLSPALREALRTSNPDAAALLDEMEAQAKSDLAAGVSLSPVEQRMMQQSARAGQAARGMGFAPVDSFNEALYSLDYGRKLRDERRNFAQRVIGLDQGFYGDPLQAILGRPSGTAASANAAGAQAGALSRVQSPFNPESNYAADIYNTNFNAIQSRNNAEASNNAALLGGIISAVGNMAGSAAGAAI